jgi:hypothetical protein
MAKFKVVASYTAYCMVEIEAEDEDQAWALARDMDGGSFTPTYSPCGNWFIEDVKEV